MESNDDDDPRLARVRRDAADLVERERALRRRIERTSEAKSRLLRSLACSQRSRLNAAKSWVALLRREHLDARARELALANVDKILVEALATFDQLVDLSRVADGHAQLALARVDLRDVVRRSAPRAYFVDPPGAPPAIVLADAARLAQIVSLLVEDASERDAERPRIEVTSDARTCRLTVVRPQATRAEEESFARTIARQLVEVHGGELDVERDARGDLSVTAAFPVASEEETIASDHARVLVVSRDADTRAVLSEALAARGARVVVTIDPDDASVHDALAIALGRRRAGAS